MYWVSSLYNHLYKYPAKNIIMSLTIFGSRNCDLDARDKVYTAFVRHKDKKNKSLNEIIQELNMFQGDYLALETKSNITYLYPKLEGDFPTMKFESKPIALNWDHDDPTDLKVSFYLSWRQYRPEWNHFFSAFCDIYKDLLDVINKNRDLSRYGNHPLSALWTEWDEEESERLRDLLPLFPYPDYIHL